MRNKYQGSGDVADLDVFIVPVDDHPVVQPDCTQVHHQRILFWDTSRLLDFCLQTKILKTIKWTII